MQRRSFLKAILAAGAAPYVVTPAGVLMPVRALAVPPVAFPTFTRSSRAVVYRHLRFTGENGKPPVREVSTDGVIWVPDCANLDIGELRRVFAKCWDGQVTVSIP